MSIKFFYADSLDLVDPKFDFRNDRFAEGRLPQRDDVYAHELMDPDPPYDGLLVSRSLFDERGGSQGRYTQAQKQRFLREGAQRFLRFPKTGEVDAKQFPIIGDCGAFSYRNEVEPPYSVDDVVEFYETCKFTHGVSVDHMVGTYDADFDQPLLSGKSPPEEARRRFELTLTLAKQFLARSSKSTFTPLGAVQGWSPDSYQDAAKKLIKMGYKYLAVGGLVPLRTAQILEILARLEPVVTGKATLHLLGVTRLDNFDAFRRASVVSLDSTSPMRQAFKDAKKNYYSDAGHYTAVRIPQSDATKMLRLIQAGKVQQEAVLKCERESLEAIRGVEDGSTPVDDAVRVLQAYEALYDGDCDWSAIRRTLADRPWEACSCPVCTSAGIDVVVFRGSNRNRRRGFHNLWWTHAKLRGLRAGVEQENSVETRSP